jgi:hypothetical protein
VYANEVRVGGTIPWRNNNPGDIRFGRFARRHGAIGAAFGFAVFPDVATGAAAIAPLLHNNYQDMTVRAAIEKYDADPDKKQYATNVIMAIGATEKTLVRDLSPTQFAKMVAAIIKQEHSKAGTIYDQTGPAWAVQLLDCGAPLSAAVAGTWVGSYNGCAQGPNGLELTISAQSGSTLSATFHFYALPSNPGVPTGTYALTGTLSPTSVVLTPDHWIEQPFGYGMVGLTGKPPGPGENTFSGTIVGCADFSLTRS